MRIRVQLCSVLLGTGLLVAVVACGKKQPPKEPMITETISDAGAEDAADAAPPAPKPLFERLGGKEGITKIVDSFMNNTVHNDTIKKRFVKLPKERLEKFKANLVAVICKESGGDCEYTGKPLKEDKTLKVTDAEWNAAVSAFKAALDENKVGENEQNDLIAAIAPMKDDVVDTKAKPKK